jgi:hypothetical protein
MDSNKELMKRIDTVKNAFCQDNLWINNGWLEVHNCVAEELGIVDLIVTKISFFFYSCTVYFDVIKSFICPNNAQLNCFEFLKFTLKFTINAHTYFGLTKPSSESLKSVLR